MINGFVVVKNNFKKVFDLLRILNIRVEFYGDKYDPTYFIGKDKVSVIQYSGLTIGRLFNLNKTNTLINIQLNIVNTCLHEIGHFIITPKQRRRRKDYGIPYGKKLSSNKKIRDKYDLEECKATMIENELKRLFGFKYRKNLYDNSNVSNSFLQDNKKQLIQWWNAEGKIITKTYVNLI